MMLETAPKVVDIQTGLPVATKATAWDSLPEPKRRLATLKHTLISPILTQIEAGIKDTPAIKLFLAQVNCRDCDPSLIDLAHQLGRNGKPVSKASLHRWVDQYKDGGLIGLVNMQEGRQRKDYGWEPRVQFYLQRPTKPYDTTVAYWLRQEGWASATDSRVRTYIKSLPETMGHNSRIRMGGHYYDQNLKPYTLRDESVLPVGFIYEGDGHNCDVYIAHPATGKAWRPELTVWIDVRSHYVAGWYLCEVESAINTLYSLSHAITKHNHACTLLHVDTGSGFKNRMMTDEIAGYLTRLDIKFQAAIAGNAKGKGLVEGFFHIFEERCGKKFETYCGHNRTDRHLSHLAGKVRRGDIKLPTLAQYRDAIAEFIDGYNNNPQQRLGCAPAELWAQLERKPPHIGADALVRPSETRKVLRWGVTIFNRLYRAGELADYNGRTVVVEYDMHDDSSVTIRDDKRRYICTATLTERKPWMTEARITDLKQQREQGQIARHQGHIEEIKARTGEVIDAAELAHDILDDGRAVAIEQSAEPFELDAPPAATATDCDIDIYDTDY